MTTHIPTRFPFLGLLLAGAALALAGPAIADEILVRDLASGQESTIACFEVTSETWSEVKYKERERSTEKSVSTLTVVDIARSEKSADANNLVSAIAEIGRGNFKEAARVLQAISGGGWKIDLETGERKYVSFSANDPEGRNKRPSWTSEYAHFYYAEALFLLGEATQDRDAAEAAWLALDDVAVPGGKGGTSGGFLGRFAGGNSRFCPNAMALKAKALVQLARYDDAAKVFQELHKAAISIPLDPQWSYEGLVGGGMIAEAKGDLTGAVEGYRGAASTMEVLLAQETRNYMRQQYGRYYSQARMRVAAVKLEDAEKRKAPAAFADLRAWIKAGMPEAVREYGKSKGLPPESIAALVAGARDPAVQAVGYTGIGLAYLNEPTPKYEEALLAFKAVSVKYFQEREQHARALYYLAQAATGAARAAKGDVKTMYESMASEALSMLRSQHPASEWARKKP